MLSLPNAAAIRAALHQPLSSTLRDILTEKLHLAEAQGLEDLTHILIVQAGDTEKAIAEELGWSPFLNPFDGHRFGTSEFSPYWAWLQDVGGWFELIHTVGNSGFGYILLIEDEPGLLPELLKLCRQYAGGCSQ